MKDTVDWDSPDGKGLELWITSQDARDSKVREVKLEESLKTVALAVKLIRAGEAHEWVTDMVLNFLESIVAESDERLAALVLDAASGRGRPLVERRRELAALAFRKARNTGASDGEAKKTAYDVLKGNGSYEKDVLRAVVGKNGQETTAAARYIKSTLDPLLRNRRLISPGKPGRPNGKVANK